MFVCLTETWLHLNIVAGSLAADGVDLTVDDGDDLRQRQTDCGQTGHTDAKELCRGQCRALCLDFNNNKHSAAVTKTNWTIKVSGMNLKSWWEVWQVNDLFCYLISHIIGDEVVLNKQLKLHLFFAVSIVSVKQLTYQVQSWGRSHREVGGRTRPGCQEDERNPGSDRCSRR